METPNTTVTKPTASKKHSRLSASVWWYVGLILLAGLGFALYRSRTSEAGSKLVLATVSRGDILETVTATGSVNAQTGAEVHIGSQVAGRIRKLNADIGTTVQAGDVIAELDLPDLQAQLGQAEAVLAQAKLRYSQALAGTGLQLAQTASSIATANAGVDSANQKLAVANANLRQQSIAVPADIARAESTLNVAFSAESVSAANLTAARATANLSVVNATEGLSQAQANEVNFAIIEKRAADLLAQGFVAKAVYDSAHAQLLVSASQTRAGQKNLTLTTQKVAQDIQTAQLAVKQSQQSIRSARAALTVAKAEQNLVSARVADVADAKANVLQAMASVKVANAGRTNNLIQAQSVRIAADGVTQAEQALVFSQAQFNKSKIKSPIAGTVLQLSAQQGETVSAGLSTQTLLIVADLNRLQIDAYVDETDIARVKIGQSVKFSVSAIADKTFDGTVQKIASGSTIQQGVVTYGVTVSITVPNSALRPDMTASVTIETGRLSGVLMVPAVAIQVSTKGSAVNVTSVIGGKQVVNSVSVVTGGTDGANVEIVSGVKEGDQVVLAGLNKSSAPTATSSPFGGGGGPGGSPGGGGGGRGR